MRLLITQSLPADRTNAFSSSSSVSNDSTTKWKRQIGYALIYGGLLFAGQISLLETTRRGVALPQVSFTGRGLSYSLSSPPPSPSPSPSPSPTPTDQEQQQQQQQQQQQRQQMTMKIDKRPAHFFCLCPTRTKKCNQELCDTILTYNDPSNTYGGSSLNLPNSTWTTARNAMYYLAKRRRRNDKIRGHAHESHYCFMDGDVYLNSTKKIVIDRLMNETETSKIIAFNYRGMYNGVKYSCNMDAYLNCFAAQSLDRFLPYSVIKDDQAWYLSQTDLLLRAIIEEPFVFKLYDDINSFNPIHNNKYPRDGIKGGEELIQQQLSEGFSEGCFPSGEALKRRQRRPHKCFFKDELLFSISFNRTHRFR